MGTWDSFGIEFWPMLGIFSKTAQGKATPRLQNDGEGKQEQCAGGVHSLSCFQGEGTR